MKLTQASIRERIEHITKAEIDRTLREVYVIDIKDIEGPHWSKSEGLNLLAYEIFNGIQQTELGNAKAEEYNLGKSITDAINSDADITVISLGPKPIHISTKVKYAVYANMVCSMSGQASSYTEALDAITEYIQDIDYTAIDRIEIKPII